MNLTKEKNLCNPIQRAQPTLYDLPYLTWNIITRNFDHAEQDILNMCRSSPILGSIIMLSLNKRQWGLTGETVFSHLVQRNYLDRNDLVACTKVSDDLGMFAAGSWRYLQESENLYTSIPLNSMQTLSNLLRDLQQQNTNLWEVFIGKTVNIDCNKALTIDGTNSPFRKTVKSLLRKYGKYLINIELLDTDEKGATELFEELFHIPKRRFQHFRLMAVGHLNALVVELDLKKGEKFYSTWSTASCPEKDKFLGKVLPNVGKWRIDRPNLKSLSLSGDVPLPRNLKQLELGDWLYPSELSQFLDKGLEKVGNTEKLTVAQKIRPQEFIQLCSLFHGLREIHLAEFILKPFETKIDNPMKIVLPTVELFSFRLPVTGGSVALDNFVGLFPSLKKLEINAWCQKRQVMNDLDWNHEAREYRRFNHLTIGENDAPEDEVDLLELYKSRSSLAESNIWRHFPRLLVVSISTLHNIKRLVAHPLGFYYLNHLVEKYSRVDAETIQFERSVCNIVYDDPWTWCN